MTTTQPTRTPTANGDANYIVIVANNGEPLYRCVYNNKLIEG